MEAHPTSLRRHSLPAMHLAIDLGSVAALHARAHELYAYCLRCDRWERLDLARLVAAGRGARRLPLPVRCGRCGSAGTLQVRPPAPTRATSGWIDPPVSGFPALKGTLPFTHVLKGTLPFMS
jgi:hypothetical protein